MQDEQIAIIGGSGFVGSRLTQYFQESKTNFQIYDLNCDGENSHFLDLNQTSSFSVLEGSTCIINLAAEHRDDVRPISKYDEVNVEGSRRICNAARKYQINKILFTSSVAIYGFAPPGTDESGEPNYFNDYGRTKWLAEKVYKEWYDEDPINRSLIIIRPTVIFGENNRGNVYNLFNQIHKKRFVMIGDGKNVKSMAYVGNVAAFISYCIKNIQEFEVFNYVDSPDLDMNSLIKIVRKKLFNKANVGLRLPLILGRILGTFFSIISKISGLSFPISSIRVKKFVSTTQFDASKAHQSGFIAPYSLSEGVENTLTNDFLSKEKPKKIFYSE